MKAVIDSSNVENKVEVDLWFSTSLDLGDRINDELSAISVSYQSTHHYSNIFTPRIATYSCFNCDIDFTEKNCVSNGAYCAYTPSFYQAYELDKDPNFTMTGRDIIIQGLREKCLHKIMVDKYNDEGSTFFTFLNYVDSCFAEPDTSVFDRDGDGGKATSLEDCYDWSEVIIGNVDEVDTLNECVWGSFEVNNDIESGNTILMNDRLWADKNHVTLHPSITVNNITYTNQTGYNLAMAICDAFREAPDECELDWQIALGFDTGFEDEALPHNKDILAEKGQEQLSMLS